MQGLATGGAEPSLASWYTDDDGQYDDQWHNDGPGKKTSLFVHFFILKMPSFYQDRLGTNIRKRYFLSTFYIKNFGPAWKMTRRGRSRASGYHAAGARRSRAHANRSSFVRVSSASLWPALVARPRALTRQLWPRPAYCWRVLAAAARALLALLVRSRSWQR